MDGHGGGASWASIFTFRGALFLLLPSLVRAHRVKVRLDHDLEVYVGPYSDSPRRQADKIMRDHYPELLTGPLGKKCAGNFTCVLSSIEGMIISARRAALGPSREKHDQIINLQFVDESNAKLELGIWRSDTAESAAARFCGSGGVRASEQCNRIMQPVAQDALNHHGFHWRDGEPAVLEHKSRLQALKQRLGGTCPFQILDVGACFGAWTHAFLEVCPEARVLMLEANPSHIPMLEEKARFLNTHAWKAPVKTAHQNQVSVANVLLGAHDHTSVEFFQTRLPGGGTGDSMFREKSNFYQNPADYTIQQYPMRSLDSLALEDPLNFGAFNFLKLDVVRK